MAVRVHLAWLIGAAAFVSFATGLVLSTVGAPDRTAIPSEKERAAAGAESPVRSVSSFSFAEVAEGVNPSVVSITSTRLLGTASHRSRQRRDFWDRFREPSPEYGEPETSKDFGSGLIIDPGGLVLTNNHVVEGAESILVKLSSGYGGRAFVVGTDSLTDLALLRIGQGGPLQAAPLGDSDTVRVGDWVIAIGNPLFYEHSVTVGVVSAKGRANFTSPFDNFIQTDAAINRGNSGGPLINAQGEVIGINTLISVYGQGIGFAIPINTVKELLPQLKGFGRVSRGFLGIVPDPVTPGIQKALALPSARGALVKDVTADTPAARAGIKVYDVITQIGENEVVAHTDLYRLIAAIRPESMVEITLTRDGLPMKVRTTLVERPPDTLGPDEEVDAPTPGRKEGRTDIGLEIVDASPEIMRRLRVPDEMRGVVVSWIAPFGAAADAELEEGDVIVEVDRKRVASAAEFHRIVDGLPPGSVTLILYQRRDGAVVQPSITSLQVPELR